jgi:uncharacterized protein (DUF885 family)
VAREVRPAQAGGVRRGAGGAAAGARGRRRARSAAAAGLIAALAAASCKPAENPAGPAGASRAIAQLSAQYWEEHLRANPLEATELGDRRFDDQLPDKSPAGIARERAFLVELRPRVEAVPATALSPVDRVTRALLLGQIDNDVALIDCHLEDWTVDARDGIQVAYLRMPELQPVRTVVEGRALAARWAKIGGDIDQETANLRRGLDAGKVATRAEVERVLGQLDDLLGKADTDWPLRTPAIAPHPDWPVVDRAALASAVDRAIREGIRPAYARYRDFLHDQVLPRARDEAHSGISNVPDGAACYQRLIQVHTSLALPAQEIHRIGMEELSRIRGEIQALGKEALGTDDLGEIQRRLRKDASLDYKSRDEIEAAARGALARSVAAEPRFLGHPPRTPVVVKRIDAFEEKDAPIAYYRSAAVDGSRPGTFYINTYAPTTRPRYETEALTFHESVPGHHIQQATAQELKGLPEFRKHLGVTAFVEGWGMYAERVADELGLYSGPLPRLGRASFEAWRACRLVVDTGMHALGWSRAQAIAFMEANTALTHENVVNEVDRYIAWPGQALAYKLGEREIRRLRADAQQRLGARFDLRAFHDVLLGGGAVSLPVLDQQIDEWVKSGGRPSL